MQFQPIFRVSPQPRGEGAGEEVRILNAIAHSVSSAPFGRIGKNALH